MIDIIISSNQKDCMPSERFIKGATTLTTIKDIRLFALSLAQDFNPAVDEAFLLDGDDIGSLLHYITAPRWNRVFKIEIDEVEEGLNPEEGKDEEEWLEKKILDKIIDNASNEIDLIGLHEEFDEETFMSSVFEMIKPRLLYWKELLLPDSDPNSPDYLMNEEKYLKPFIEEYYWTLKE